MPNTGCLGLVHWDDPEGWYGRREEGSGWGTHVYPWWIHFDIWQNKYNIVKLKNKIKSKKIIITLKVNRLNAPTKRHILAEWIQKQDPYICCLQETHFRPKDTYRLKMRRWKIRFHENGKQKKVRVSIFISDKIDLKTKITRDKDGHYIIIKESIQEEDITIVSSYKQS